MIFKPFFGDRCKMSIGGRIHFLRFSTIMRYLAYKRRRSLGHRRRLRTNDDARLITGGACVQARIIAWSLEALAYKRELSLGHRRRLRTNDDARLVTGGACVQTRMLAWSLEALAFKRAGSLDYWRRLRTNERARLVTGDASAHPADRYISFLFSMFVSFITLYPRAFFFYNAHLYIKKAHLTPRGAVSA